MKALLAGLLAAPLWLWNNTTPPFRSFLIVASFMLAVLGFSL